MITIGIRIVKMGYWSRKLIDNKNITKRFSERNCKS